MGTFHAHVRMNLCSFSFFFRKTVFKRLLQCVPTIPCGVSTTHHPDRLKTWPLPLAWATNFGRRKTPFIFQTLVEKNLTKFFWSCQLFCFWSEDHFVHKGTRSLQVGWDRFTASRWPHLWRCVRRPCQGEPVPFFTVCLRGKSVHGHVIMSATH